MAEVVYLKVRVVMSLSGDVGIDHAVKNLMMEMDCDASGVEIEQFRIAGYETSLEGKA